MQIHFSERELEDFLCTDDNLQKHLGLKFIARQVSIAPIGIIDILAYDVSAACWVIIELKKGDLDSHALAQGMSYLNFYQETKSLYDFQYGSFKRKRKFCLLLVGNHLGDSLCKVVSHSSMHEFHRDYKTYYKLFGLDLSSGIDFTFYNTVQRKIEEQVYEIYSDNESNRFNALDQEEPIGIF